jgi:MoxR-like ATPase
MAKPLSEQQLVSEGTLPPKDFHDHIERIREMSTYELEIPDNLEQMLTQETTNLLVDHRILVEAAAALQTGHLVLQGPPGTGKSSLARALCRAFSAAPLEVTAHEEWSTFEVIGRQTIDFDENGKERILPVNGYFTEAVIQCAGMIRNHFDKPEDPQATWLLIDELNRAHLDKAFGELFTTIGTDDPVSMVLSHQRPGNRQLVTPRRFRIIATLNTVDRQFVNSMGQGLKRRFTFITVNIPPPKKADEPWGNSELGASLASREFTKVLELAAGRRARRTALEDGDFDRNQEELLDFLKNQAQSHIEELFDLISTVRYSDKDSMTPHLPIGTSQIIDTIELFLSISAISEQPLEKNLDWAASVKIAPLFDADTINPTDLEDFAQKLPIPFNERMKRELLQIASAGLYYV